MMPPPASRMLLVMLVPASSRKAVELSPLTSSEDCWVVAAVPVSAVVVSEVRVMGP